LALESSFRLAITWGNVAGKLVTESKTWAISCHKWSLYQN